MKKRKGGLVFFHNIEDNVFQNKKICNNNTAIITLSQPFTIMYAQTKKKPKNVCAQYMCKHVHIYTHKCMYVQCVLLVMVSKK